MQGDAHTPCRLCRIIRRPGGEFSAAGGEFRLVGEIPGITGQ